MAESNFEARGKTTFTSTCRIFGDTQPKEEICKPYPELKLSPMRPLYPSYGSYELVVHYVGMTWRVDKVVCVSCVEMPH